MLFGDIILFEAKAFFLFLSLLVLKSLETIEALRKEALKIS